MNELDNGKVVSIEPSANASAIEGAVVTKPKSLEAQAIPAKIANLAAKQTLKQVKIIKKRRHKRRIRRPKSRSSREKVRSKNARGV